MVVNGNEQLAEKPFVSAWRAPTDNDRGVKVYWGYYNIWQGENLDRAFNKIYDCDLKGGTITVNGSLAGVSHKPLSHHTVTYTVFENGKVEVKLSAKIREDAFWLPRFGVEYLLPATSNEFSYFGNGPYESYRDMRNAGYVGRFNSTAEDEYVNYIMPQEHGNHTAVKELAIGDLIFKSDNMEINVSKYSSKALTIAEHIDELKSDGFVHLRVDYKVSGIGSGSCGPQLNEKYRLAEKEFDFAYSVQPK